MVLIFIQSSLSASSGLKALSVLFFLRFLILFIIQVDLFFRLKQKCLWKMGVSQVLELMSLSTAKKCK